LSLTNGTVDSSRISYAPIEIVTKDWNNDGVDEFLVFGYGSWYEEGGIPFRDDNIGYVLNILDADLNIIEQFNLADDNHIWGPRVESGYQEYSHMCIFDADGDGEDEIYIMISSLDELNIYSFSLGNVELINSLRVESEICAKIFAPLSISIGEWERNSILIVDEQSNIWNYDPLENEIIQVEEDFDPRIYDLKVGNFDDDPATEIAMATAGGFALYELLSLDNSVENSAPTEYNLVSVYPNPFNSTTTISFSLHTRSNVNLQIYNIRGQLVDELLDREMSAGRHNVTWDAEDVVAGVYLVRMKDNAGRMNEMRKVVLMK